MDPSNFPSPCYVIDLSALRRNLEILQQVRRENDCRIVLALKGFSMWSLFPLMREYLGGCCASGLWEARLAHEHFGGELLTYAPAYKEDELGPLIEMSSHLDFNSRGQWEKYRKLVMEHPRFRSGKLRCGIRVNPECSTGSTPLYDPCAPCSRLGATVTSLEGADLEGISGVHFHTLCEQGAEDLEVTLKAVDERFGWLLSRPEITWMNLGGGHWITKPDYDLGLLGRLVRRVRQRYGVEVWLEPGEAAVIHTGVLLATVMDVVDNGMNIAILDVSATAHMPDVLEMPYRPDVIDPRTGEKGGAAGEKAHTYRLGGPTCLAGDVVGDYSFSRPLRAGDFLVFDDMAHYTMVKTTMFNGVRHPAIATFDPDTGESRVVREFSFEDYRDRLS